MELQGTQVTPSCLVVEDDNLLGEMMVDLLTEDLGLYCQRFSSGDDALFYLLQAKQLPLLVVTDNRMPGDVQGKELAELIAKRWPELPVVLTSGSDLGLDEQPSPKQFFLMKPWSAERFQRTAKTALSS